jgi:DNA-binding CsgD family transcriptional regulator/tetratricopeptide (TPR) repeat protein
VLLGREREQEVVEALLSSARAGNGGALAIVGDQGIGKTALLSYAATIADGMHVLQARGVPSEAHVPFAGLHSLLRPALGALDRIPPHQAEALAGALALRPARGEDRFAVGAATLSLLAAYAEERPVLAVVDDAHWLDGSSASALRFAARRLAVDPVAVLLAARNDGSSLLDDTDIPRIDLGGLDLATSTELLRQRAPAGMDDALLQDFALRLHTETGGNPLALLELASIGSPSGVTPLHEPTGLLASVARGFAERCASLPERTRWWLLLLAAAGLDDLLPLAPAASKDGADLDDLEPAEKAGLVSVRGGRVEWRHPLVRSAVYAGATASERRRAHRMLADSLPDADADRRAWHLALAAPGRDDDASSALEQVGVRARHRSAHDEASLAFERAAQLAGDEKRRAELAYTAADAAWLAGAGDRALRLLDAATAEASTPDLQTRIEHLRGHIATRFGNVEEGLSVLLAGARLAATVDNARAVVMFAEAVNACFYAADPATMVMIAEEIPAVVSACTDARSAFFASLSEGMALVFSGEGDRGPELLRRAMVLLESSDELRDDPKLLTWAAMGPLWLREAADWSNFVDGALEVARERCAVGVLPFLLCHVAIFKGAMDRWDEAEAEFTEAVDLATETGQDTELAASLARLAALEARRGRFTRATEHASAALELSERRGLRLVELWSLVALGEAELTQGRLPSALDHYERLRRTLSSRGVHDADLSPAPELVEIALRTGDTARAGELSAGYARDAATKGLPWALARSARTEGLVAADDEFEACFERALAFHTATLDVFETARTHLAYGSRLRRSRQRVRARVQLRSAVAIFDRLGADPWSDLARAELLATGEQVARRGDAAVTSLTPQELQVAVLLSKGRTTRETAAALFLSPKTVEYHLRSIYRKLDISSRDELAAAMSRR